MNDASQVKAPVSQAKSSNWLWRYTRLLFIGFLCWLIIRSFFVQGMYIPSASMEGTLYEGDYIYVNKLAYGPRLTITPLTIPFTDKWLDWITLPYYRFPGTDSVRINDVIVFNLPTDTGLPVDCRQLYIKRCVALPGDSFAIARGQIMLNSQAISPPEHALYMYAVALKRPLPPDSVFGTAGIKGRQQSSDGIHYVVRMTTKQADSLEKSGNILTIVPTVLDADRYDYKMFPQNTSKSYRWNADNFGPLVVPAKGQTIALTLSNIHLYKTAIVVHEKNTLENRNDSIYINGVFAPSYTFTMNYYFVMGDNRYDSFDSRYWGFVPEDHLIGRAGW